MADLVGHPEDRFSHVAAQINTGNNQELIQSKPKSHLKTRVGKDQFDKQVLIQK